MEKQATSCDKNELAPKDITDEEGSRKFLINKITNCVKNYVVGEDKKELIPYIAKIEAEMGIRPQFSTNPNSTSSREDYSQHLSAALCEKKGLGTILKTRDGCLADSIYRRNGITLDIHMPKQTKHTLTFRIESRGRGKNKRKIKIYSFDMDGNYEGQLMDLHCLADNKTWVIPYNILRQICGGGTFRIYDPPRPGDIIQEYEVKMEDKAAKIDYYYGLMENESYRPEGKFHLTSVAKQAANICVSKSSQVENKVIKRLSKYVKLKQPPVQSVTYDRTMHLGKHNKTIQVKTARKSKDNKYVMRLEIKRYSKKGTLRYKDGDFQGLYTASQILSKAYLIPIEELIQRGYVDKEGVKVRKRTNLTLYPFGNPGGNGNAYKTYINNLWTEKYLIDLEKDDVEKRSKEIMKCRKN